MLKNPKDKDTLSGSTMNTALIAISNVVTALDERKLESSVIQKFQKEQIQTPNHLLESINFTVSKYKEFLVEVPPPIPLQEQEDHLHLIEKIRRISQNILENKRILSLEGTDSESLFSFLGKEDDENFHSDYIATILNPKKSGRFAFLLYYEILRFATHKEPHKDEFIKVKREMRLDALVPSLQNTELGPRRIDILVQSESYLLVIENKINSSELNYQTSDYHKAVVEYNQEHLGRKRKKLVEIILSPTGLSADCSSYISMSYIDLFQILTRVKTQAGDGLNFNYIELYLRSLYKCFYQKDVSYFKYLINFWRTK